jgi:hypothetical protein
MNRHIEFIKRYVDDTLIVYDSAHTSAEKMLSDHNQMHTNIKYTLGLETYRNLNCLDLSLHKHASKITI